MIALACSGLGHVRRGNETWAQAVAEQLHRAGETVQLCGGGPLTPACPYQRVWNVPRDWSGWRRWLPWGRRYAYEQQTFAWALARQLRRLPADIVQVADPVLAYRLSLAARRLGFQLVYKDGLLLGPDWCRRFDWVQVLAPYYQAQAEAAGIDTRRWHVIPHMVDTDRFRPAADRLGARVAALGPAAAAAALVVLAVGDFAVESSKRLDWVAGEVVALGGDAGVHLVLAGQAVPAQAATLAAQWRTLGGRLHLRPNTPPERMPELYRAADVFAHAAVREPFGIAFIEALASGVPALGHTYPVTEWIIGAGGVALDMTCPGRLTEQLRQWLRNPGQRQEAAAAARARAEAAFAPHKIVPLYRDMYAAVRRG